MTSVQAPSREDPLVRRFSTVLGGPAGSRLASATGLWHAASVLVLLASVMLSLAVVGKQHCRVEGWSIPDQFWHACYSDVPALYGTALYRTAGAGGANPLGLPDALAAAGQPPLAGTAMWLVARLVPTGSPAQEALAFFDLSVIVLASALLIGVTLLAVTSRRRGWDAAHLALSPVILTAAFVSYELLAVLLVVGGLLAWSRYRPVVAGVLVGSAVAARPAYVVLVLALLLLALRTGRWAAAARTSGVAVGVWLGLRVLLLPGWSGGLAASWETWKEQGAGFGSVWLLPDLLARSRPRRLRWWIAEGLSTSTVTALVLGGLLAVLLGALLLTLGTARRPRLAHVALFLLAGVLLVGKAVPPQAALLLLPLVALSALRWRDHLLWAGAEVAYFVAVWLHIAANTTPDRGLTPALYAFFVALRAAGLAWLMVCAVRAARHPERDLVRRADLPGDAARTAPDDPLGGDLDGAPDALVVRVG